MQCEVGGEMLRELYLFANYNQNDVVTINGSEGQFSSSCLLQRIYYNKTLLVVFGSTCLFLLLS